MPSPVWKRVGAKLTWRGSDDVWTIAALPINQVVFTTKNGAVLMRSAIWVEDRIRAAAVSIMGDLPQHIPLVIIESPYAGDLVLNRLYAAAAMADSLERGEAPFLSHLLYTQVLDDSIPEHRARGIAAGLAWGNVANFTAVYNDLGVSAGMEEGIQRAKDEGRPIVGRQLPSTVLTAIKDQSQLINAITPRRKQ